MPKLHPINHDANKWLQTYEKNKKDPAAQKKLRASIFSQTQAACKQGFVVKGKVITIAAKAVKEMLKQTRVIHTPWKIKKTAGHKTEIEVVSLDTLKATKALQDKGYTVAFLNMANAKSPGGGAKSGAAAQEEAIFRVSNAYLSLYPSKNKTLKAQLKKGVYHVPEFGAIYTKGVTIFRKAQEEGFAFRKPFQADMISNAAYDLKGKVPKNYDEGMKSKIRAILRVAHGTNHDAVVLGAHGCGAFKNDPKVVSKLFKDVLKEKEFDGAFQNVTFAIIDDQNSNGNLACFKKTFHK